MKVALSIVTAFWMWVSASVALAAPQTGYWWNPSEPGRGYVIEVQNGQLFFGGFLYETTGRATWLVSIGAMTSATQYSGALLGYSGGQTLTGAFKAASSTASPGTVSLTFISDTTANMTWPGGTIALQRFDIVTGGAAATQPATNPQAGWWYNASEPGRGFSLEVQNNNLFLLGYMYDSSGNPIWYLTLGAMTSPTLYSGVWSQVGNGQTLTGSYKPNATVNANVGAVSISFPTTTTASLTLPSGAVTTLSRYNFGGSTGSSGFTLTSAAASNGSLPADYTCDGSGSSPALAWSGAPSGTKSYALLMTTLPGDGTTKYNWVVYNIPAATTALAKNSFGIASYGLGSDGSATAYQPPCSQGPGTKQYTFTLYALSGTPSLPASPSAVTGAVLSSAISSMTLGTASLSLNIARDPTTASANGTNCGFISASMRASKSGTAQVGCDSTYAYVSSTGIPSHTMMNGITATNLQVPTPQNFLGSNGWRIPLSPAIASTTTSVLDGPVGVAINGVPIFNPCKQGGCAGVGGGDTKALGELDICNGHAGRADDYHYHAAPTCVMADQLSTYWNTHPVGWALDGFAIFGYNNADGTTASRDSICGGNTSTVQNAPSGYSYHVTDSSPYVLSCLRGTPSPDLSGQSAKYSPIRQPPVTPFTVSNMTLSTDATDGYSVLQFTSPSTFVTTTTGTDSTSNTAGTYRIRYKQVTGDALTSLLALNANANKTACWTFQFQSAAGATTQPTTSYCR